MYPAPALPRSRGPTADPPSSCALLEGLNFRSVDSHGVCSESGFFGPASVRGHYMARLPPRLCCSAFLSVNTPRSACPVHANRRVWVFLMVPQRLMSPGPRPARELLQGPVKLYSPT